MIDYENLIGRCDLYARAIKRYGKEPQLRQLQEECGELITAINRYLRGRTDTGPVEEEVADVEIMLEQMYLVVNPGNIKKIKEEKLDRLAKNLNDAEDRERGILYAN